MMEQYVTVSLNHAEQDIILPQPISFSPEHCVEVGIAHLQLPTSNIFSNVTDDEDYIKAGVYKKYKTKHLRLFNTLPIDYQLNHILDLYRYKSYFNYEDGCFHATIHQKYFMVVSEKLRHELGMPDTKIEGRVTGEKRTSRFTSDKRSEYLDFYSTHAKKTLFRIEGKHYATASSIRNAFMSQGVHITAAGKIEPQVHLTQVIISPSLRRKLIYDQPIYQIMLYSNIIECSNVGDAFAPLFKMIPCQHQRSLPELSFEHVQYKRLLHTSELNHLHFKVCDDVGQRISFKGIITITLHLRDASC